MNEADLNYRPKVCLVCGNPMRVISEVPVPLTMMAVGTRPNHGLKYQVSGRAQCMPRRHTFTFEFGSDTWDYRDKFQEVTA